MRATFLLPVLLLLCCSQPPAMIRAANKVELIGGMQRDLLAAMEAQQSAALAVTDEESGVFAAESKKASQEVERARLELRRLIEIDDRPTELAALDRFEGAWRALLVIEERLLALAVANTNIKASRLASGEAAAAVNELVDALAAIELVTSEPSVLRQLSGASVAALRIQGLLPAHIASPSNEEMAQLEGQMHVQAAIVEQTLAVARKVSPSGRERADEAWQAWARCQHLNTEIVRLSRLNTNVLSSELSVHEKRLSMISTQSALSALLTEVKNLPRATR